MDIDLLRILEACPELVEGYSAVKGLYILCSGFTYNKSNWPLATV
jgi:hypothetical protein